MRANLTETIQSKTFGIPIRDPRTVALLHPFQLPIVVALFAIAVVFTLWPEALDHAPISFEKRGIVHHIWHYALLAGSAISLYSLFIASRHRLKIELVGLVLVFCVIAMNVIAAATSTDEVVRGFDLALRVGLLLGIGVRLYILIVQPTITVTTHTEK